MADLDRINDLIRAARANWFGLLAYLAFVGVTLMGVQDADFFIVERETTLPLIGVDIPTFLFFWVAPALGAALYAYLHLNLLRLWEALGDGYFGADAKGEPRQDKNLRSGPLTTRTVPWLVIDHALSGTSHGPPATRPMRSLANLVTWSLTYAAAPLVLAFFFWRSMPAHDEALTVIGCALPLWVALYAGLTSARHRRACLTGRAPRFAALHRTALWLFGLGLMLLGWFTTEGTLDHYVRQLNRDPASLDWRDAPMGKTLNWSVGQVGYVPIEEDLLGREWSEPPSDPPKAAWSGIPLPWLLVRADLTNVDFVNTTDDWRDFDTARKGYRVGWCRDHGLPAGICGPVQPSPDNREALDHRRQSFCADNLPARVENGEPSLTDRCTARFAAYDAEFAEDWQTERDALLATLTPRALSGRDFRGADLGGARMEGVDLVGARMEGAFLVAARMEGANLFTARLERANLVGARMEGADLGGARMEGANLWQARMEGAVLVRARLEWAILREGRMEGADLSEGRLEWANLFRARLEGADLSEARMEGVNLREARMEGADLVGARMEGAFLVGARMSDETTFKPATLRGAGLKDVNLSIAITEDDALPRLLAEAFGDASVTLPEGLKAGEPPLDYWSTETLDPIEFYTSWRDHQHAIGYVPPD